MVRNIITIGNNISEKSIAVKGGVLKSINQNFVQIPFNMLINQIYYKGKESEKKVKQIESRLDYMEKHKVMVSVNSVNIHL